MRPYEHVIRDSSKEQSNALAEALDGLFAKSTLSADPVKYNIQRDWQQNAIELAREGSPRRAVLYAQDAGPSDEELLTVVALLGLSGAITPTR